MEKIYDFDEAINQGFLLPCDSIFLGWLFPEYLPAISENGSLRGEHHISQAIDPSLGANSIEDFYSDFPFGRLTDTKAILTLFDGPYSNWQDYAISFLHNNDLGITLKGIIDSNNVFITFKKKILVRFVGKYDFPVLILPEHIAYMV